MSLLFEHAISEFEPHPENHYSITGDDLTEVDQRIPVKPIIDFATRQDLEFPDLDANYTCIPLHTLDRAELTGKYLAYGDTDLYGEIIIYREEGERQSIEIEEFAETRLAQRIRFWHSDYQPDEFPPDFDRPVSDREKPTRSIDPEVFLTDLNTFIEDARRARRQENNERARSSTAQEIFEEGGSAIPNIEYEDDEGETVRFSVRALDDDWDTDRDNWAYYVPNTFGVHQGNEVLLHGPSRQFPIPATVTNIHGLGLEAKIHWSEVESPATLRSRLMNHRSFGLSVLLNPVPTERELDAVEDLRHDPMVDVLAGQRPLTFSNPVAGNVDAFDSELNQEQEVAADLAMLADDIFCIHGPPGTGKTRSLIEIIRRAAAAGERVLVCADSNQAVDNIVVGDSTPDDPDEASLHAYSQYGDEEFTLARTNAENRPHDIVSQYDSETVDGLPEVVATTNNRAAKLSASFDLVVHDEATQATVASSCIPISKGNRVVLAGDHKQLPPFSSTESPPESHFGMSLFEHLYADGGMYEGVGIQLKTQYRMHRDIAAFSNREFYENELRNGRTVGLLPSRDEAIEACNLGGSVTVEGNSRANENEAKMVTYIVSKLLEDLSPNQIGIITPYTAQVQVIRDTLRANVSGGEAITVDTIDSFQGSEREAIVLSLVRSNADGDIGFLGREPDGPRRLNVALTRAKRYCAVVTDIHTLRYEQPEKCTDLYHSFSNFFEDTNRVRDVDPDFLDIS